MRCDDIPKGVRLIARGEDTIIRRGGGEYGVNEANPQHRTGKNRPSIVYNDLNASATSLLSREGLRSGNEKGKISRG